MKYTYMYMDIYIYVWIDSMKAFVFSIISTDWLTFHVLHTRDEREREKKKRRLLNKKIDGHASFFSRKNVVNEDQIGNNKKKRTRDISWGKSDLRLMMITTTNERSHYLVASLTTGTTIGAGTGKFCGSKCLKYEWFRHCFAEIRRTGS